MLAEQLSFGPFRLDEADGSLWRGEERVPITRKALQVLAHVATHAGRLVTKDSLLRTVWPDTHVSDAALRVIVLEIRKVLGDRQRGARFIETVYRRGYRFVAPVRREPRTPALPADGRAATASAHTVAPIVVGRHDIVARLHDLLGQATAGQRQTVFVTGEAGIGKTTLVETFLASHAPSAGAHVARGQCVEHHGAAEAYMPVLEALGRLCRGSDGAVVTQVLRERAPTWLVQMPWLVSAMDRERLQREILGATRERMLRELAEAVEALTADTPLVLVLEDLHWSDSATVDLLAVLGRRSEAARLLVLGTYRPADLLASSHPLVAVTQELHAHRRCVDVPLALLTPDEVEEFVRLQLGERAVPPGLVEVIFARTEGNPLFMVNVVDDLLARETYGSPDGAALDIEVPASLRGMIEKQLRRLDAEERKVLEAASVAGVEFRPGAVAATLEQDAHAVEQCCTALASEHLFLRPAGVVELPDGSPSMRFAFVHALHRAVLYDGVAVTRRLRLHRRLGEEGEATHGSRAADIAAELAAHFEAGRDHARAIRYLVQAAETDFARFASREAITSLTRALRLVDLVPASDQAPLRDVILERRGCVHRFVGNTSAAVADYEALVAHSTSSGTAAREAEALLLLARELSWVDMARCLAVAERAVVRSQAVNDPLLRAETRAACGYWHSLAHGWFEEDFAACRSAVDVARQARDQARLSVLLARLTYFQHFRSDYRGACATAAEGLELAPRAGEAFGYLACAFFLCLSLLHLGEWDQLRALASYARQMAERNGQAIATRFFEVALAWLHLETLDFAGARELATGVVRRSELQDQFATFLALTVLGRALVGLHDYPAAEEALAEAGGRLERGGIHESGFHLSMLQGLSELHLGRGDLAAAALAAEQLCALAARPGERTYLALGHRTLALVAQAAGDSPRAQVEVSRALAVLEGAEAPLALWRVHATAAQL
jgi:DNA-binding winged helix-turn-helix (wHTH) protein